LPICPVSKIVLVVLLIFSVASWALILHKWRFFREQDAADAKFLRAFEKHDDPLEAFRKLQGHRLSGMAAVYAEIAKCFPVAVNGATSADAEIPNYRYVDRVLMHALQAQISKGETYLPF